MCVGGGGGCLCACAHRGPWKPEESIAVPGAGVTGCSEMSYVAAGNRMEEQYLLLMMNHLSHVPFIFLQPH